MRGGATLLALSTFALSLFLTSSVSGQRTINGCPQRDKDRITVCIGGRRGSDQAGNNDTREGWRDRNDRPDRSSESGSSSNGTGTGRTPQSNRTRGSVRIANDPRAVNGIAGLNQKFALLRSLQRNGAFAQMVASGKGHISLSVQNDLKPNSNPTSISYLLFNKPPDYTGHHYLTLNYLGRNVDIDAAWKVLTERFAGVFPTSNVTGPDGPIRLGNRYNLVIGGVPHTTTFVFPVTVTNVSPYAFTFSTRQGHWLQGSATHGIVKDADGEVYLFQEGVGVPGEQIPRQVMNYAIADSMWARLASNIRSELGQ